MSKTDEQVSISLTIEEIQETVILIAKAVPLGSKDFEVLDSVYQKMERAGIEYWRMKKRSVKW